MDPGRGASTHPAAVAKTVPTFAEKLTRRSVYAGSERAQGWVVDRGLFEEPLYPYMLLSFDCNRIEGRGWVSHTKGKLFASETRQGQQEPPRAGDGKLSFKVTKTYKADPVGLSEATIGNRRCAGVAGGLHRGGPRTLVLARFLVKLFLSRVQDGSESCGSQNNAPVPGMLATALASSRSTRGPRGRHGGRHGVIYRAPPPRAARAPSRPRPLAPRKRPTRRGDPTCGRGHHRGSRARRRRSDRAASTRRQPRCRYSRTRARLSARHLRRARPSSRSGGLELEQLRRSPRALRPRPDRRKRVRKAERRFRPRVGAPRGRHREGAGRRGDTHRLNWQTL